MTKMRVEIDDELLLQVRNLMREGETLSQWIEDGARHLIARKQRERAERESRGSSTNESDTPEA